LVGQRRPISGQGLAIGGERPRPDGFQLSRRDIADPSFRDLGAGGGLDLGGAGADVDDDVVAIAVDVVIDDGRVLVDRTNSGGEHTVVVRAR
jgi:hypothetical protein